MEQSFSVEPSNFLEPVIVEGQKCYGEIKSDEISTNSFKNMTIINGETLDEKCFNEKSTHTQLDREEIADGKNQLPTEQSVPCKKSRRNSKMKRVGYGMYYVEGVVLETKEDMMERFENRRENLLGKLDRLLNDESEEDVEDEIEGEKEAEEVAIGVEEVILDITDNEDESVKVSKGCSKEDKWTNPSVEEARVSTKDVEKCSLTNATKPRKKSLFKLGLCLKKPNKSVAEAIYFDEGISHSKGQICSMDETTYVAEESQMKCPDSEIHIESTSIRQLEGGAETNLKARFKIGLETAANDNEEEVANDNNDDSYSKRKNKINKKTLGWSGLSRLLWRK